MDMPKTVNICEVGPRDGFQNVKTEIPTATKIEIIEALFKAGFKRMEITSFVSPKAIPQMKDAKEVCEYIIPKYEDGRELLALAPNKKGAENAYNAGLKEIAYVMSLSESHNKSNINRTREESLDELKSIRDAMPDLKIQLDFAVVFGCPFEGDIKTEILLEYLEKIVKEKVELINLCDTIGVANPKMVYEKLTEVKKYFPNNKFSVHIHDTRGMGLACYYSAILAGFSNFETSIGGLGGCPFAPGAAGNTATEDLVNMLNGMDINTGIDLRKLLDAAYMVKNKIENNLAGRMVNINNCSPAYNIK